MPTLQLGCMSEKNERYLVTLVGDTAENTNDGSGQYLPLARTIKIVGAYGLAIFGEL